MDIDWRAAAIAAALIAFNLPILFAALQLRKVGSLSQEVGQALKEKDAAGDPTGATSYSRVTGAIGTVMVGSLFWVFANVALVMAITTPLAVGAVIAGVSKMFLVGAALFLPYAFNQLKSVLQ